MIVWILFREYVMCCYRKHRLQRVGQRTCGWNPNGHSGSDTFGILFISLASRCTITYTPQQSDFSDTWLWLINQTLLQLARQGKEHQENLSHQPNLNILSEPSLAWIGYVVKRVVGRGFSLFINWGSRLSNRDIVSSRMRTPAAFRLSFLLGNTFLFGFSPLIYSSV